MARANHTVPTLVLVPGVRFAELNMRRDPVTWDLTFDAKPMMAFAAGNGIDYKSFPPELQSWVLQEWYRLHREAGGAPDPVCEAVRLEVETDLGRSAISAAMQARAALTGINMQFPSLWQRLDELRAQRGTIPKPTRTSIWPDWCFVPMHLVLQEVEGSLLARGIDPGNAVNQAITLTLTAAWRPSQGVYRFDPDVYQALVETKITGDIPHNVLMRLPEWCVFIETPGMDVGKDGMPDPLTGVFVGLDPGHAPGASDNHPRLLMTFMARDTMDSLVIALGPWSLPECVARALHAMAPGYQLPPEAMAFVMEQVMPVLSLVLYLCTDAPDLGGTMPAQPQPSKTRRGLRFFPPPQPRQWDVAVRIGSALRAVQAGRREQDEIVNGNRAPMRPHMRKAHWHGFWSGPRDGQRRFRLQWLPPIPVNITDPRTMPAVVHPVL